MELGIESVTEKGGLEGILNMCSLTVRMSQIRDW